MIASSSFNADISDSYGRNKDGLSFVKDGVASDRERRLTLSQTAYP